MVTSVEKQKQAHLLGSENVALHRRTKYKRDFEGTAIRKTFEDKKSQFSDHCARIGHTRDTCFKLHGKPDSYKELVEQKRRQPTARGFMIDNTDMKIVGEQLESKEHGLLQKLMKLIKGNLQQEE
ncbi:hypothetical protein Sango_1607400 [Sesamum angolense]|uniref:Uncharacterized protein n=1 Tax=Sesamum angolense TaxID=2727404 RepID=A0AAE1WJQ8_9LAMI|nr:hypothetical protein Sango_1607400 [Sesamum angolense]